nr:ParB N-terminal domain-containing protein [Rectinema sp.]HPL72292.1 ParB N-terminal domain-containing protein [Rectinema sp.]
CKGAGVLDIAQIVDFQGNLKRRGIEDIEKLKTSILKYGFSFPFFIWVNNGINYCFDGHGRLMALKELRKEGYSVPELPVVYVEAKDEDEAKQKLLRLNSQYGQMTLESVLDFAKGLDLIAEELSLMDGGEIDLEGPLSLDLDFQNYDKTIEDYLDHFDITLTFEKQYEEQVKGLERRIGKEGIVEHIVRLSEEE